MTVQNVPTTLAKYDIKDLTLWNAPLPADARRAMWKASDTGGQSE